MTAALSIRDLASPHAGPFSLTLAKGECLAVCGPSGSGKSLLLRMIADLDPNHGNVALYGQSRAEIPAPAWRRKVIYQAAEPAWWEVSAGAHFSLAQLAQAQALLPRLGLKRAQLDLDISRLSTGERQRMALLRSLLQAPQVLLLDEATAALDAAATQQVEALLRERIAQGLALIFVTHDAEQAQRMGQRRLWIEARTRP